MRNLIYIAVFAVGVLIGGVFPGFSAQYQHRLEAQFDQVSVDLKPFREIAGRYHGGSLEALIDYHLASDDPTFHDEGLAITNMMQSEARLAKSRAAFESSFFEQALYLYRDGDSDLLKTTWDAYTPAFVTTRDAVVFAMTIGVMFCFACYLSSIMILSIGRRFVSGRSA